MFRWQAVKPKPTRMKTKPREKLVKRHLRDLDCTGTTQNTLGQLTLKTRIGRFHAKKKGIAGGGAEALDIENGVRVARQPIEKKHAENAPEDAAKHSPFQT